MESKDGKGSFTKVLVSDFFKTFSSPKIVHRGFGTTREKKVENTTQFTNFFQIANNGV